MCTVIYWCTVYITDAGIIIITIQVLSLLIIIIIMCIILNLCNRFDRLVNNNSLIIDKYVTVCVTELIVFGVQY